MRPLVNSNYSLGLNPSQPPLVRGGASSALPLTRGSWRGFGSISGFNKQAGFTLVEMIMVIVITGIIGGMVAVFLKAPIQQYMDVARRAELTDIADTAIRRMARDVRTAVPNSVRLPGGVASANYIEFLPTKDGGRYRANNSGTCGVGGNELLFAAADDGFEVIGPAVNATNVDYLVVGSTQSTGSIPYDRTPNQGGLRNIANAVTTAGVQCITFASNTLPASAQLDSQRFQVVRGEEGAVTYSCEADPSPVSGGGAFRLVRYWNYWNPADTIHTQYQPGVSTGATSAVLASNVGSCNSVFSYDIVNQRNALVAITLQITKDGEQVNLYNEIHVNNAP